MELYLFALIILAALAVFDLMVGVSNDAVNFLNSAIGSRVAPRYVIMIIASLGILAGVTFSSGMMEIARKGIFHPKLFLMPELITIFLAVMITDVILLDLFNTFGLPTSTTVSIVFELLGAAVAVSLFKIYQSGESYAMLVEYINTGKALAIISGILMSVVVAFFFGVLVQFATRLLFTFDYAKRLKRYSGIWGGIALAVITYFILIKGAKGTSFLSPETVSWIKTHTWTILFSCFLFFSVVFQLLMLFTRINVLKPVVLVGTFALAMAFAANDLVNFIGVPLAGLSAFTVASGAVNPLTASMEALQESVQSNTLLLLLGGAIMMATLWVSKKARGVTETGISLGRQDEGVERFGSSIPSRLIVRIVYLTFDSVRKLTPKTLRAAIADRLDTTAYDPTTIGGKAPSFDLIRASVNLIVASAIISFATSLKLPLSTTYVTFMVAMGTSLADQAWGRESAVYRVTGVLTVIGGWFFTAFAAFTIAMIFASLMTFFSLPAIVSLLIITLLITLKTHRYHAIKEEDSGKIEVFSLKDVNSADMAIKTTFEQTGHFLGEISNYLRICFESAVSEDRDRLKNIKAKADQIHTWSNVIIANIFKTLYLLYKDDPDKTRIYSSSIRSLQSISECFRGIVTRTSEHFENYHAGFTNEQKEELRHLKTFLNRLLWNTSIMLLRRKKVDYDYVSNQCQKIINQVTEYERTQIKRIQEAKTKARLSILFYGLLRNTARISHRTKDLLVIFRESFNAPVQKNNKD